MISRRKLIAVLLVVVVVAVANYFFNQVRYIFMPPEDVFYSVGNINNPKGAFASMTLSAVDVTPNADTYELPISLSSVSNFQRDVYRFMDYLPFHVEVQHHLEQNGFVFVEGDGEERFLDAYTYLGDRDIPIFVTTDSLLHLYHIFYSQILKNVEINEFIPMLRAMLNSLVDKSVAQYNGATGDLKEAARRNVAFLSVAGALLDPAFVAPIFVADEVAAEIAFIEEHEGFKESPLFSNPCPCDPCGHLDVTVLCVQENPNCLCEDYSQYVPRGHYTQTEDLKRYFKAMMWFGRLGMRIKSDTETLQAVLLTDALKSTQTDYNNMNVSDLWSRIYKVTGFFVGTSDDLTFYEYDAAVTELFGDEFDENLLLSGSNMLQLKEKLKELREPQIHSGFVHDTLGLTNETQGLRFMGQRYTPDSYVLWKTVFNNVGPNPSDALFEEVVDSILGPPCSFALSVHLDCDPEIIKERAHNCNLTSEEWTCICGCGFALYTGTGNEDYVNVCRAWPSGMDVMSVLNSTMADEIQEPQTNYCNYTVRIDSLKEEFSQYDVDDWTKNIYWSWLWTLKPLLNDFSEGYPIWMQTDAWKTKELNTALSSWSELRHDTILYVKQSYTTPMMTISSISEPMEPKYYGYVEPVPEFYARLKDLTELMKQGLMDQGVITADVSRALERLSELIDTLKTVAEKEVTQQALTEDEYDAIADIGSTFKAIIEDLAESITVHVGIGTTSKKTLEGEDDAYKTTLVADVHTETNTEKVLETATGYVDWMIVVHKAGNHLGAAIGPVFTYYEFQQPMEDRLTDEAWRTMLEADQATKQDWLQELYGE